MARVIQSCCHEPRPRSLNGGMVCVLFADGFEHDFGTTKSAKKMRNSCTLVSACPWSGWGEWLPPKFAAGPRSVRSKRPNANPEPQQSVTPMIQKDALRTNEMNRGGVSEGERVGGRGRRWGGGVPDPRGLYPPTFHAVNWRPNQVTRWRQNLPPGRALA